MTHCLVCIECGRNFVPLTRGALICSAECRRVRHRRQMKRHHQHCRLVDLTRRVVEYNGVPRACAETVNPFMPRVEGEVTFELRPRVVFDPAD